MTRHHFMRSVVMTAIGVGAAFCAHATDSNMGETSEVLFCNGGTAPYTGCDAADLRAKANALTSPVAIFEYVRNNYDYSLYHGARSGSVNTYLGGRGGDVDLAATLIAMLRSQGIPAHYVVGTVRVPATQVANWLQVEDTSLAKSLLVDQGIQKVASTTSGSTATLDFEHVWVEALVPYGQYRGAGAQTVNCAVATPPSTCHWVPLDPSFKQYKYVSSGLDPYAGTVNGTNVGATNFDYSTPASGYYYALKNTDAASVAKRDKNPLEIYQEQVLSWLGTNAPGKTLQDISDFQGIVAEADGLLPASLPYAVVGTTRTYNSVGDHDAAVPATEPKKWNKYVTLTPYFNGAPSPLNGGGVTVDLVSASTKRLTYSFQSTNGTSTQGFYLGGTALGVPLSITAGTFTINGETIQLGAPMTLVVQMDGAPAATTTGTDQVITAQYQGMIGGYYLVATGGETSNWSQVHRAAQQLLTANQTYPIVFNPSDPGQNSQACDRATGLNCTPYVDVNGNGWDASDPTLQSNQAALDALTGGLLYVAATQYYAKVKDDFAIADQINKIKTPISGFLGVVSATYQPEYVNGTAFEILPSGLLIDMKGITIAGSWRINAPNTVSNAQFNFIGHVMSSLEHETWQELTGYDAISTVRGIQMALANNATLLDLIKNTTTDTGQTMYAATGYTASAPSGFTLDQRSIYSTKMDSWWNATADSTQSFAVMQKLPTCSDPASNKLCFRYYANGTFDGVYQSPGSGTYYTPSLACFYDIQNQLNTLQAQHGSGYTLGANSLCISSIANGTTVGSAIATNQSDYATFRTSIGASWFDFFDENKGFSTSSMVFRPITGLSSSAQPSTSVGTWRNTLYLQDLNKGWNEFIVPSLLSVGSNFRFSVDILKTYDTSNNLNSATFEIQNMATVAAGGGFVGLSNLHRKQRTEPAKALTTAGTTAEASAVQP